MAFWMDPLMLLGIGAAVAWIVKIAFDGSQFAVYVSEALVMAATYALSVGLFLNVSILSPVWRTLGAETGTEFMINGLVLSLVPAGTVWTDLGTLGMFAAILSFALYPVWLRLGVILGRILVGRDRSQDGLVGLVRP